VQFQPVELPAPVGGVEARCQPDDRPGPEFERRFDVAGHRGTPRRPVGPGVYRVGDADPRYWSEPCDQQGERVDAAVVQRPDIEEGVGPVVPVGDSSHVGVGVAQSDGSEPSVGEQLTRPALGGCRRRARRTTQCEAAVASQRQ